jgi:tetratricopeptide (TPR) repeat protein
MSLYHPLTMLSFSVEKTFFGESPFVRRLDNLILHTANAALVFWFFILLGAGTVPAFWTSLLWAVNPVQTESVAWVAERKNLLCAFFYLSALIFYLRYSEKKQPSDYAAALFMFLLSLFSKAAAVTLPFALILIDIFKGRAEDKRGIYEKIPFFVLSCIFAMVAVAVQLHTANASFKPYPHSSLVFYLKEFFIPFGLSTFYPYAEMATAFGRTVVLDAFWLMAIFAALFWSFKKGKKFAFGFLFFTINIFPFIFVVPTGEIMTADRYLYISGIGLAFIPVVFFCGLAGRYPKRSAVFTSALALLALVWSFQTFTRAAVWENGRTLWASVLEKFPESETANLNMYDACLRQNLTACSREYLKRTLKINPSNHEALCSLGGIYAMAGKTALAENLFKRSIMAGPPSDLRPLLNLSVLYYKTKRYALAEKALKHALVLDPDSYQASRNLCWVYMDTGRCAEATALYANSIKAEFPPDPDLEKKLNNCEL